MVKGKKEEVETPPELPPEETPPETQTPTFTQEDLDNARLEGQRQYQGLQKVIAKKDRELDALQRKAPTSNKKVLAAVLDEIDRPQEELYQDPGRGSRISQLRVDLEREEQLERMNAYAQQERERINQIIEDAGFSPTDEAFEDVEDAYDLSMMDGNFARAEKKARKIIGKLAKPVKEPEPDIEKLVEEGVRKMMEEKGELTMPAGGPSGALSKSWTTKQIKGMDSKTYQKEFPGGIPEIMKLAKEGRILEET